MSDFSEPPMSDGGQRTGWAELGSGETVELARPGARFGGRILDIIIASIINFVIVLVIVAGSVDSDDTDLSTGGFFGTMLIFLAIWLVYEVVQVAIWGQTLGKRMTGIKVIHATHGGVPGWGKALGRWAIPGLVFLIPFIGGLVSMLCYLSLTWDRVYQGWHDKAAGTLVVRN